MSAAYGGSRNMPGEARGRRRPEAYVVVRRGPAPTENEGWRRSVGRRLDEELQQDASEQVGRCPADVGRIRRLEEQARRGPREAPAGGGRGRTSRAGRA